MNINGENMYTNRASCSYYNKKHQEKKISIFFWIILIFAAMFFGWLTGIIHASASEKHLSQAQNTSKNW